MTPGQIDLVRRSYAALGDGGRAMAGEFYRRLFGIDPSARALFSQDLSVMTEKFAAELHAIVEAIVSYDVFAARLRHLAVRHHGAGVRSRHYGAAADALIGALAMNLGPDWTAEHEFAWRRAFNLVAEIMISATAELDFPAAETGLGGRRPRSEPAAGGFGDP